MSAFMMSRESLSNLATTIENAIRRQSVYPYIDRTALKSKSVFGRNYQYEDIYRKLYKYNAMSVNERYKDDGEDITLTDEPSSNPEVLSDGRFLKSLECWLYQSCEFDGYRTNPTYNAVESLCTEIMTHIAHHTEDYINARWGD